MTKNLPATTFDSKSTALLKKTYAKDLNEIEFDLFMAQAKAMNLNPFNKEIYPLKFSGRLSFMTSIGGLRKVAHASGKYLGCKITVLRGDKNEIISATAVVKKMVGNVVAEFEATTIFDEYSSGRDNWAKIPQSMISKVAESAALRMAFPALDQLNEPAEETVLAHETIDVDLLPATEHESQALPEERAVAAAPSTIDIPDPGAFMLKLAKNKFVARRVDAHAKEELQEFLTWAYKQERLNPVAKEGVLNVEEYLKQQGEQ